MNLEELRTQLAEADPGAGTYFGDYTKEPVYILDAEGFVHEPKYVTWDADDHCFYINTKFVPEGTTDDGSRNTDLPSAGTTQP